MSVLEKVVGMMANLRRTRQGIHENVKAPRAAIVPEINRFGIPHCRNILGGKGMRRRTRPRTATRRQR